MRYHRHRRIGICHYHLCRKRTKLYRCKYCREHFCRLHLWAKPAGLPRFKGAKPEDQQFMDEWRKPAGHPCIPYMHVWERKQKEQKQKELDAFNKFLAKKPQVIHIYPKPPASNISKEIRPQPPKKPILVHPQKSRTPPLLYFLIFAAILGAMWLFFHTEITQTFFTPLNCSDGTFYDHCSSNQPLFCSNGTLINNSGKCGCPADYKIKGSYCQKIQRCIDGTIYGECSSEKPKYCGEGILVAKASKCGCLTDEIIQGEICVSKFEIGPEKREFTYVFNGNIGEIPFTVYSGLDEYLSGLSRSYYCSSSCPSDEALALRELDQQTQKKYLLSLVNIIKSKTNNLDDQARIAINLVQQIPYDWEGFKRNDVTGRYPYEVLYDKMGVCGEKSGLLVFILRELGFGVVFFDYGTVHRAVGIKCPPQYDYKDTGYCFIEAAAPTIPTNSQQEYVITGKLPSEFTMLKLADGVSFDSISKEYADAQEWNEIATIAESSGGMLDWSDYNTWSSLVEKYGLAPSWQQEIE